MAMFRNIRPRCPLTYFSTAATPLCRARRCTSSALLNLRPTPESQRQWFDVLQTSPSAPRSVVIDTYPDPYYSSSRHTDWGVEGVDYGFKPDDDFYRALETLYRLPNVNQVALRFTSDCFGAETEREPMLSSIARDWIIEDRDRRSKILDAFFEATAKHCRTPGNQRLKTLTVRNLQNTTSERVTNTDNFRDTIKHLKALNLQICTEWDNGQAYMEEEMYTFWPHLRSRWLEPLANQLDTLTLYWDTRWGLYPPVELRDLHFSKLRSLSLGTYVFGSDNQLQWLLSHKTLQHLSLDACVICSKWLIPDPDAHHFQDELRVAKANFPVAIRFDPKAEISEPGSHWEFEYGGRWPAIFDQLAKELPELRDFQFADNWDPFGDETSRCGLRQDTRFEDRHSLSTVYKTPPYVVFFPGQGGDGFEICPLSDVYGREVNAEDSLRHSEKQSLDALLQVIKKRASSQT